MSDAASPEELHAAAVRLREACAQVRARHRALRAEALGLAWQGPAARAHAHVRLGRREHAMTAAEHALTALAAHLDRAARRLSERLAVLGPHLVAGDTGPHVVALQRLLAATGHPAGPLDGQLGPRTESAVRAFQRTHALADDGFVGPRTALALAVHADGPPAAIEAPMGAR